MKFKNVWNDAYETMAVNVGNPGEPPVWKKKTVQVRRGLKNRKFAKWDKMLRQTKKSKPMVLNGKVLCGSSK